MKPLLDILMEAKMVFHEPKPAANHINAIWDDPDQWWNSTAVLNAKKEFNKLQAEYNSMINNTDKAVIDKISKQVENEKKNNKVKKS